MDKTDKQDLSWVPPYLADTIIELAEKAITQALEAFGHDDTRVVKKEAAFSANAVFIGEHCLTTSWMAEAQGEFIQDVDFVGAIENKNIAAMIGEGAEMHDSTMVEWMQMAIQKQFARDCMKKGERDGTLIWTGEYRDREPVFVHVGQLGNNVN